MSEDTYISRVRKSCCILCGKVEDLRCGVCFACSDFVGGKPILEGHELWDIRNPEVKWKVGTDLSLIG